MIIIRKYWFQNRWRERKCSRILEFRTTQLWEENQGCTGPTGENTSRARRLVVQYNFQCSQFWTLIWGLSRGGKNKWPILWCVSSCFLVKLEIRIRILYIKFQCMYYNWNPILFPRYPKTAVWVSVVAESLSDNPASKARCHRGKGRQSSARKGTDLPYLLILMSHMK